MAYLRPPFIPCKIKVYPIFALVLMFLVFAPERMIFAKADVETLRRQEQQLIERKIQQNRIRIERLQAGLETQKEDFEETQLKEKGVLAELEELDLELFEMADRLNELKEQMRLQQELILTKESELEKERDRSQIVEHHMLKRISAYYKLGKIDLVNITFTSQTFPDLLRFHDSFQTLLEYDQEIMQRFKDSITQLERAKKAYTLEKGLLEEFISQAAVKEEEIKLARQEKAQLLKQISNQAALHEQAIKELQQATVELGRNLLSLKKKEKLVDQGFLVNKGAHLAPLDGTIISRFKEERYDQFGTHKQSPGIIISAPDGTKIRSIFFGRVIYSGYLKGYGNTVVIDHGYQYFTITSRIERMLVKKGDMVKRGSTIGIMGSTATILDEGLYFEIRLENTPLDPLEWLEPTKLSFKAAQPEQDEVMQIQQVE